MLNGLSSALISHLKKDEFHIFKFVYESDTFITIFFYVKCTTPIPYIDADLSRRT